MESIDLTTMAARTPHSSRLISLLVYLGVLTLTLCVLTSLFGAPAARAQLSETLTPTVEFSATPTFTFTPTSEPIVIEPTATPPLVKPTLVPDATESPDVPTPTWTILPTDTPAWKATPTDTPPATPIETATPEVTPTPTGVMVVELSGDFVPGQLVLKLAADAPTGALNDLSNEFDLYLVRYLPGIDAWLVNSARDRLAETIGALSKAPAVAYAEPNYRTRVLGDPVAPGWFEQATLIDLQIPQAWEITQGSPDAVVAVIDTGLDVAHPDLASQVWINAGEDGLDAAEQDKRNNGVDDDGNGYVDDWGGWNFIDNDANVADHLGHGTHLAGLIAAATNNGAGISGIAPGARVMALKAAGPEGTYAQLAEALVYAANRGARVINISLGGDAPSWTLKAAVKYALQRNVVVVAASGGGLRSFYPAAYDEVIAVGSTVSDPTMLRTHVIGRSKLDLLAPGEDVLSTWPGGYGTQSGSSVSAAQVSGIAALLASVPKFDLAADIREALLATALHGAYAVSDGAFDRTQPAGLVQAYAALNYGEPLVPAAPTALNEMWGQTTMVAAGCTAAGGTAAYTPASFDALTGSCAFTVDGTWTYGNLRDLTNSATVNLEAAVLTTRWFAANWVDDQILIEVSNNGTTWTTLDTFQAGNPPTSTLAYLTYDVSPYYTTVALANAAQVRFRVVAVNTLDANLTIASDQARIAVLNAYPPIATPVAPAPQPTVIPGPADPHVAYAADTDKCAACHRAHTGAGQALRQAWPEENVCFMCHTANATPVTATNVYSGFAAYTNTATAFYKHDIAAANGLHRPGDLDVLGGSSRHIECEDCHEPHEATRGAAPAPMIQRVMSGTTGVLPIYTGGGVPAAYAWLPQAEREHQVCLKCHSNFTTAPTYVPAGWNTVLVVNGLKKLTSANALQVLDSRNLAAEFNPYAASFHPVLAQGRNQNMSAAGFVAGWSQTSLTYCSDCHQNNVSPTQGPHASPLLHILAGTTNYKTGDNSTPLATEVCFKSHSFAVYVTGATGTTGAGGTNFYFQTNRNLHSFHVRSSVQTSCYTCHDSHGSEQQHLMNFDLSVVTPNAGYNSQTAYVPATGAGTGRCYIGCHGHNHSGDSYP